MAFDWEKHGNAIRNGAIMKGVQQYQELSAAKQALDNNKKTLDMDFKIKKLQLDKAIQENALTPLKYQFELDSLKMDKQIKDLTIKKTEQDIILAKERAKQQIDSTAVNFLRIDADAMKAAQSTALKIMGWDTFGAAGGASPEQITKFNELAHGVYNEIMKRNIGQQQMQQPQEQPQDNSDPLGIL